MCKRGTAENRGTDKTSTEEDDEIRWLSPAAAATAAAAASAAG